MLSEKQIDYIANANSSFNIAIGAVSSGKTFAQVLRWYSHVYDDVPDGSLLLMSGKTGESLHDNVIRDFRACNPSDIQVYRQPLRVFVRSKGIEIACADAHNEGSWGRIQGKTVYGWLADEIVQHPRNFVIMAQQRCRGGGSIWPKFWTANPDVPTHFIKRDYIENQGLDVKTWNFGLNDNPVLSQAYKDELKASHSGVFYDRFILGKWVLAEGSVYDEFNFNTHCAPFEVNPKWEKVRGIDFGYTNPFVCLFGALDEDGRLYIYDEHYEAGRLMKYHADRIKEREGLFSWSVADHDAQDNAELRSEGVNTVNAKKDVSVGIQRVKSRLCVKGDGRSRLFIHPRCKNLAREIQGYRWQESKDGKNEKEEPIKNEDHALDALRYMVMKLDYNSLPEITAPIMR